MNIAKKALSSVVVSTTILWSMGASMLVGPLTAHAAVADGTLIKAKEVEAVYYYMGGKRWTFPNLKTYKTWYKDFSSVQMVTLAELQTYQLTGNAVYRPGTRLVKITTDPKVYAVEPNGKLRWLKDEATAKGLFGNAWAARVDDVSDAFFTNYSIGADLSAGMIPDGSLVQNGANWFYILGGKKLSVSESVLASNSLNTAFAITADVSALAAGGALADGQVKAVTQGNTGGTPAPAPAGGALSVSLASDNPTPGSIVIDTGGDAGGQRFAKMLKVNFTANGGDVAVTQLQAKRLGISKDGDVDTLYLADANGKLLSKNTSFSSGVGQFTGTLFTVPAGQTMAVWLLEDVNASAGSGSTQGWSVDAAGIKIAGTGSVTGSAMGSLFTVASVSDMGQVEFASSSPLTAVNVDAGKTSYTLGTFKFRAVSQDILLKKLKLTQIGTISPGDLANFKIQVGGVQFDAVKAAMDGNTLSFDLTKDSAGAANADMGIKILSGQTKFVDLVGDVVGGTSRNFKFSVQNQEDVTAFDNNYKVYVPVFSNNGLAANSESFAVQTLAATTINTGTLTISLAADTAQGNVALNGSAVSVGKYTFTASGEDMKLTTLSVTTTASDYLDIYKNVKIYLDGTQVGSTVSTLTAGNATAFTFTNNFVVRVGKPSVLEVFVDLTDTTQAANSTFAFQLVGGSSNGQGLVSLTNISSTAVSANTLTLKTGAPTVAKNTALTDATTIDPTGVVKDLSVKIGSFVITAGAAEASKITSIAIGDYVGGGLSAYFNRIRLQNAGANIAAEVGTASGASSTYTYTLTTPVTIAKGAQYVVDVVADVLSTTSNASMNAGVAIAVVVAANGITYQTMDTGQSGTMPSSATSLQNIFLASKGSLVAAVSADTPIAQQLVMGSLNVPIYKFKLTAGKVEDISVTDIATAATIMASASSVTGIVKNLRLYDGDTPVGSPVAGLTAGDASAAAATSTAYAKFSALSIVIPKNTSKTYTVVADIASSPDTYSSENFTLMLIDGYDQSLSSAIVSKGAKSGQTITSSGQVNVFTGAVLKSNVMTTFRTKISLAHAATAPSGASSANAAQTVAKFVVSNTANVNGAAAIVSLINVDVATSISMAAATARLIKMYKTENLIASNQVGANSDLNLTANARVCVPGTTAYVAATCGTWALANFTAVTIEAGTSQTFVTTFDTSDAASAKTLTVGAQAGTVTWSDGYTAGIITVDGLPLSGKTLTY